MIIENGILNIIGKTGGGIENGVPVPVGETIGVDIPCNISTPHDQRRQDESSAGSAMTTARYTVLIDQPIFTADEVVLWNSREECLGRCRVQSIQYLDSVNAVQIKVERYADYTKQQ